MYSGFVGVHRLLRDVRSNRSGNVLALTAAAVLPVTALIGGGVDISRAYMAKTELQAACDAGVLAGRRAMSKSGEYGTAEMARANAMFNFNFDRDALAVANTTFATDDNEDGQVIGVASGRMPTLIMRVFGKDGVQLEVDCMAELQISNADVMFVLDTTGSMGGSRIAGLRDAVRDFHRTINAAVNDDDTRIRYGFVPYSMTVNARGLLLSGEMPTSFFAESADYQSREARFNTQTYVPSTAPPETAYEQYSDYLQKGDCDDFADNDYPGNGSNPATSGSMPNPVTQVSYSLHSWTKAQKKGNKWYGPCIRKAVTTRTTYQTKYGFSGWRYRQIPLTTANFATFISVPAANNVSSATVDTAGYYDPLTLARMNGTTAQNVGIGNHTWNGCIEERLTVDEADFDPVPEGAFLEPFDSDTQWKPHWPEMEFLRNSYTSETTSSNRSNPTEYCPAEMMLFREVELSDDPEDVPGWLDSYVNGLVARGNTYHDIGMIWGTRLSSPTGIFADNVNLDADTRAVSRHIIFMTDGRMEPSSQGYSAYGMEYLDSRIAPRYTSSEQVTERHNARFVAACTAAKARGITVWVVAFGTSMTDELEACASNGRAYFSNDTNALRKTFSYIASQVADLRLGQ